MQARSLLAILIFIGTCVPSLAQVFHYKTGKAVPHAQLGEIYWEEGTYFGLPARYGTLITAENFANKSKLISLPVIQLKCFNPAADSLPPVFILNGGPGETNLRTDLIFDEILHYRSLILVGYRGVDGYYKLRCPGISQLLQNNELDLYNADSLFSIQFQACLAEWGLQQISVQSYGMQQVVEDIELCRQYLGLDSIAFFSFSYGTMLAQLYAQKYAQHVEKMVLLAPRPIGDFMLHKKDIPDSLSFLNKERICNDTLQLRQSGLLAEKDILYKYYLYQYGRLYTNTAQGNKSIERVEKDLDTFYKNFPGQMLMGDLLVKKQGWINPDSIESSGCDLMRVVNSWYNSNINVIKDYEMYTYHTDSTSVLFLGGQNDVAAPLYKIYDSLLPYYPQGEIAVIPNASHLDLFLDQTNLQKVKRSVVLFFQDVCMQWEE